MSILKVVAERLVIHPHPNADALELAEVGRLRAVVAKDAYRTGDHAVYLPEGSVLPEPLIAELGLTGRLAGPNKDRITAVRLRGELSQGIVCRPKALADLDLAEAAAAGTDFAEVLGVTKWVPPIPVHLAGDMHPAEDLLPWLDVENIRRYPLLFSAGEPVVATEKIHGSACLMTYVAATGTVLASSKGFGKQRLAIKEADSNLYWRAIRGYDLPVLAAAVAADLGATRVGVFGEVYGRGVQDLGYGVQASTRPGYAVFDIAVDVDGQIRWLTPDEVAAYTAAHGVPAVPVLYRGPYDEARLVELAEGVETISGTGANIREGLVVRPLIERYSPITAGRAIGKLVSTAYLTRKGGTEYE
ncbi:RNA ligase (ATP) [Catellatospora tritici]|uniref:RNA ligase (ATP) n=1 Tax=Catellatospora tritici TaxID=2851566 RepID=UPI001C2D72D8|nr:RNA ligase (ATP) [Catellatospora tritici]MBV1848821.1 RNA ligase (ATP) [Catellatospora tritici]